MKQFVIYSLLFTLLLLSSCNNKRQNQPDRIKDSAIGYAKGFDIDKTDNNYTKLTVFNPWNDYKTHTIYYLVKNDSVTTPKDGFKVKIPLKRVVINSATYLGFLDLISEIPSVVGTCNSKYIYNPKILEGVSQKNIVDLGDSFNLNFEQLILSNPDIIFTSAYSGDKKEIKNFTRYNITPVFGIEWQEPSLLGRAEWIKFFAEFYDKRELANNLFSEIEENYNKITEITLKAKSAPSILSGQDFRGSWSMPSGSSYNAQLFRAAKSNYFYSDNTTYHGSIPLTIEEALVNFHDADFWVNAQANSLEELVEANSKYKLFKAFKEGRVFNNNKRTNASGGNDYWEMGIAKPDLLLKDLVKALHPELLPNYEFTFMTKLK